MRGTAKGTVTEGTMRFAKKPALRTAGILLVLLAVFTLAIAAFADEASEKKVVFVSASRGSDGGDGSRNAPFGQSMRSAIRAARSF